jgi:hypothetical protein
MGYNPRNLVRSRLFRKALGRSAKAGCCVAQLSLTGLIVLAVGLLAFTAYGSVAAALTCSIFAALLWTYLIRL